MVAKSILKGFVRFIRRVIDEIEDLVKEISDDPLLLRALEADLGLPSGGLAKAKESRPDVSGIGQYINAVSPSGEQLIAAAEFIQSYVAFWKGVFAAAQAEDSSLVADELVYHLFQVTTVNTIKYRYPEAYYWMRLLGAITQDLRLSVEEGFAPDLPANIFKREYWANLGPSYKKGYLKFRLDQAADLLAAVDQDPPPTPDELIRLQQLGFEVFGWSDLILLVGAYSGIEFFLKSRLKKIDLDVNQMYGWELPPGPDIPLSERIASRGYTLKLTAPGGPPTSSAILTQFLEMGADGRIGWLLSLRGSVVFTETAGSKERPLKIKITVDTPDGLDMLVRFSGKDRFQFNRVPTGGMKLSIEPAKPATVGPAISIPEVTGTRLEIGDFTFKVDISKDGFKIKASTLKSALVIVPSEGDDFTEEMLKAKEVRIEFDLGIAADQDNGIYFEGGNRLSTTIPINKSLLGINLRSVQLSLNPTGSETGSELQFAAAASLGISLGPLQASIEQIGFTLNVGTSSNPPPADAISLLPFLYLRNLGFKPPSGVGVLVDSNSVTGGGFLFFDKEQEQYAGALELSLGDRLSLKALGLLTTRLPDGTKGFSLLIIISVEFSPALQIGLGITISGIGGLLGIRRTVDTNVLREGLHNKTLDAILFPKDPVANAGRLLNVLRGVFPPARDRHLLGLAVILGFGTPPLLTAELAVIYEFGDNPRLIILGQLHMALPRKKPILEIHMDALGIWDIKSGDFSLDARLYDSHIAFVTMSGDMALRVRRGNNPFFLLSIGGYHPDFAVPPDFPKLERLTIKFADSEHLRLILTGYFAVSSNTRQAGGKLDFFAGFGGFSIEGFVQIDLLWEPDVRFIADFDIKVALKYKGHTLLGAHAVGQFFGPEPKRLKGKVSIDLFLFDISKSFDKTFGDDRPPLELPQVDPLPQLVAALQDGRSWEAQLPAGSRMLVTQRKQTNSAEVLVHPLGGLSVRQQVLPLGIHISRFAGSVASGEPSFSITKAILGVDPVDNLHPVNEFFAPADFLNLTDDEKLARPSFESMPAGISLVFDEVTYGGKNPGTENQAVVSEMDFDNKIIGASGAAVVSGGNPGQLRGEIAVFAASFGPAGRSVLRSSGGGRFQSPGKDFRVRQPTYVVAGVDDLKATAIDGASAVPQEGQSFTVVQQALAQHLKANPQAKGLLQVVAGFQTEETA